MKFNCGLTKQEKFERAMEDAKATVKELRKWHKKFAFFPIRLGSRDCRWLECVERSFPYARAYEESFTYDWPFVFRGAPEYRSITK